MENLFTGTTLLAALAYIGYQLKTAPTFIWAQIKKRIIYSVHIDQANNDLFNYFEAWLNKYHAKSFKNVRAKMDSDDKLVINHHIDIFVIKYNKKRLLISKAREKFENAGDLRSAFHSNFSIEGWFAKSHINDLLKEVVAYSISAKKQIPKIYTNDNWGEWNEFGEVYGKTVHNVVCDKKEQILTDIDNFLKQEEWYIKRGLAYKRGFLFYGMPGNGKTSLCLALSQYLKRNIQFLNLNDLEQDRTLFNAFSYIKNNSILVIEDVDAIFGTREGKSKISFSALLNCMDGAFSKHGLITIMTTNHIEKIDPALLREGRIDVKVYIDNPNKRMVEEYLSLFYEENIVLHKYDKNYAMSKIQEICLQNKNNKENAIKVIND